MNANSKENSLPETKFDSNVHLKTEMHQKLYVNTDALDIPSFEYKFNKISDPKKENSTNPRIISKSKFSWQINEFD